MKLGRQRRGWNVQLSLTLGGGPALLLANNRLTNNHVTNLPTEHPALQAIGASAGSCGA